MCAWNITGARQVEQVGLVRTLLRWIFSLFFEIGMAKSQNKWNFESDQLTLGHLAFAAFSVLILCCFLPTAMCLRKPPGWHEADRVRVGMTVDQVIAAYDQPLDAWPADKLLPTMEEHMRAEKTPLKRYCGVLKSSAGTITMMNGAVDSSWLDTSVREPRKWENAVAYTKETGLKWLVSLSMPAIAYFETYPQHRAIYEGRLDNFIPGEQFWVWGYEIRFHFRNGRVVKIEREVLPD